MRSEEILACSFPKWYSNFSKSTIKSIILPIPGDVLAWLKSSDTLRLPKECDQELKSEPAPEDDNSHEDEEDPWEEDDEEDDDEAPHFPEFSSQIRSAVSRLGGKVFCKLNWSSPRDATWVAFGNSLQCTQLSQIYLLLKSSEFLSHDLLTPFDCCEEDSVTPNPEVDYVLVLRKWTEINPGYEYRCFVKDKELIGVTQRDCTKFYNHIEAEEGSILTDIRSFYREQVQDRFPLNSFVFDVVRRGKDKVNLIDFNPYGPLTDGLLFDWDQDDLTTEGAPPAFAFRYIRDGTGIQPNGMRQYSLPRDMVDLASGRDPDKLIDFLKLQQSTEAVEEDQPQS